MSAGEKGKIETGRIMPRTPNYVCESCNVRRRTGKPRAGSSWASRLRLSQSELDLLLLAAVEYALLSDEVGEYESVIEFIDWVAPTALGEAA